MNDEELTRITKHTMVEPLTDQKMEHHLVSGTLFHGNFILIFSKLVRIFLLQKSGTEMDKLVRRKDLGYGTTW